MYSDEYYMAYAISLARRGWYSTHPNPRVGCVIVKNNHIIADGWHQIAGQGHAEVNALAALKESNNIADAQGATAYVTLEPCSHHGKTPPCSQALVDAGIKKVVVAMEDPNPLVEGKGISFLRENDLQVKVGVLESEARLLNPGFIQRMENKRPKIRCKMGMSLDGRTAMANGESQWITSPEARKDVQRLRAESSAILTGIGTVLADDPSMTVRSEQYKNAQHQPERVVLDSSLKMPETAKMLSLQGQTHILTDKRCQLSAVDKIKSLQECGADIHYLSSHELNGQTQLDLSEVLAIMAQQQYNDVLLEAGATLTGSMLQAGYVDELIIYMAPGLMGSDARGLFNLPGMTQMSDKIHLHIQDIRAVGKDFRITASVDKTWAPGN